MVEESPGPGAVEDVLLEEVLAGGHVAVQELGTAVIRPPVPAERKNSFVLLVGGGSGS